MIAYPNAWREIGAIPDFKEIEDNLIQFLELLNCNNLALSGGIDSSYMLWCMTKVFGHSVNCYTIALNKEHPDFVFSENITKEFGVNWNFFIPEVKPKDLPEDNPGDSIVRTFFNWLSDNGKTEMICCDGIDEFMGGYYSHLHKPTHETYYDFMVRLKKEQLEPLDKSSGKVAVFLPYLHSSLIGLYDRIPMSMRFGTNGRKKVITNLACGKIPDTIINRRKYGFVDAMVIKEDK